MAFEKPLEVEIERVTCPKTREEGGERGERGREEGKQGGRKGREGEEGTGCDKTRYLIYSSKRSSYSSNKTLVATQCVKKNHGFNEFGTKTSMGRTLEKETRESKDDTRVNSNYPGGRSVEELAPPIQGGVGLHFCLLNK